jgi:hypothetical protein
MRSGYLPGRFFVLPIKHAYSCTSMIPTLENYFTFAIQNKGEVSEWSKEHAWKVCILQKGIEGSNPSLSADFNIKLN